MNNLNIFMSKVNFTSKLELKKEKTNRKFPFAQRG